MGDQSDYTSVAPSHYMLNNPVVAGIHHEEVALSIDNNSCGVAQGWIGGVKDLLHMPCARYSHHLTSNVANEILDSGA